MNTCAISRKCTNKRAAGALATTFALGVSLYCAMWWRTLSVGTSFASLSIEGVVSYLAALVVIVVWMPILRLRLSILGWPVLATGVAAVVLAEGICLVEEWSAVRQHGSNPEPTVIMNRMPPFRDRQLIGWAGGWATD